jgi:hypothetical protein
MAFWFASNTVVNMCGNLWMVSTLFTTWSLLWIDYRSNFKSKRCLRTENIEVSESLEKEMTNVKKSVNVILKKKLRCQNPSKYRFVNTGWNLQSCKGLLWHSRQSSRCKRWLLLDKTQHRKTFKGTYRATFFSTTVKSLKANASLMPTPLSVRVSDTYHRSHLVSSIK